MISDSEQTYRLDNVDRQDAEWAVQTVQEVLAIIEQRKG